jgi:putative membrane protein
MEQDHPAGAVQPPDQVQLALERTYLAYERTLMAWVRTATGLITFGFTLYKFFFYLREQEPAKHSERLIGPRACGLIMMELGVFTLAAATWQYREQIKRLRASYAAPYSLSLVLAPSSPSWNSWLYRGRPAGVRCSSNPRGAQKSPLLVP